MPTIHRRPSFPTESRPRHRRRRCRHYLQHRHEILRARTMADYSEEHTILKKIADPIQYKSELLLGFMGMKQDPTDETTYVICDGGVTSTLSSSFENCTD
jgi:hypothetical protein